MLTMSHKNENPFFRHDLEGRNVFYPWGYPGEAFYTNNTEKKKLLAFCYFVFSSLCICSILSVFAHYNDLITLSSLNYLLSIVCVIFPITYIFGVYELTKTLIPYVENQKTKLKKKILMPWLIVLPITASMFDMLQFFSVAFYMSLLCFIFSSIYVLFISFFLLKLQKNKGYFLTNRRN